MRFGARALLYALMCLPLSSACQDGAEHAPRMLPDARPAPPTLRFLDRNLPTGGSDLSSLIDQAMPGLPQDQQPRRDRAAHGAAI